MPLSIVITVSVEIKKTHKTRCVVKEWSLCLIIMITRSDVQRVVDAFILEETLYWWSNPIERVNTVRGIDAWNGYHWLMARQLAQDQDWVALKHYMDSMSETHLRETMEQLIQSESPRLYREYWTA